MPRFWQPPEWRHVVTTRFTETVTFLDRLATNVTVDYDLNTPSRLTGLVPSDNPEVNIEFNDIYDDPFLHEGTRFIYSFRQDDSGAGGTKPYGVRHSGIVLGMEDIGDPNVARSRFTVMDPWAYLYSRQVVDEDGLDPVADGFNVSGPVAEIALTLLKNTIDNYDTVHIDAGEDWSGTADYAGFIADDTVSLTQYNIPRGKTVGEVWDDLCSLELMDIELVPIYDPLNRPGYLSEVNIYRQPGLVTQPRGEDKPQAIFSWDLPPRTLSSITRRLDGQSRANYVQFYARNGLAAGLRTNPSSRAKYGDYQYEQQFPDQVNRDRANEWAAGQMAIRARGIREVIPLPSPQQPPLVWDEFFVGDRVPVYASNRLRGTLPTQDVSDGDGPYNRVVGITFSLDPQERMTEIRVMPEPA